MVLRVPSKASGQLHGTIQINICRSTHRNHSVDACILPTLFGGKKISGSALPPEKTIGPVKTTLPVVKVLCGVHAPRALELPTQSSTYRWTKRLCQLLSGCVQNVCHFCCDLWCYQPSLRLSTSPITILIDTGFSLYCCPSEIQQ